MFAQYPLHHVTYSATKFEVHKTNSLGGDSIYKKLHARTHRQTNDGPTLVKKKVGITIH